MGLQEKYNLHSMIEIACIILILLLGIALLYMTVMSKRCRERFWETVFRNVPNYLFFYVDSEYNYVFYPDPFITLEENGLNPRIIILLSAKTKSTKIFDYRDSSWLATEKTDPIMSKELYRRLYEKYAFRISDIGYLKKSIYTHLNELDRITMIPLARIFKKFMSLDPEKRKSIIGSSWYNGESELDNSIRYFWKCMSEESLSTLWTQLRQLNKGKGKTCFTL